MLTLSRRGYIFNPPPEFPNKLIGEICKELTVAPKENGFNMPTQFRLYFKSKKGEYIFPRYYGLKQFGKPEKEYFNIGNDIDVVFKGQLRPLQIDASKKVIEAFNYSGGGILSLQTGHGKTITALYCISRLKLKTLVIVNRIELVNQWQREINSFLCKKDETNVNVSKIQGRKRDFSGDIVVAMINTVSMGGFKAHQFNCFDLLIVDECHSVASEIFSSCLPLIRTPYTLGLSATPERKDGLMKIVQWYMGDIVYKSTEQIQTTHNVEVKLMKYRPPKAYTRELYTYSGKPNMAGMLNRMAGHKERTNILVKLIKEALEDENREILVLSDRKTQLKELKELIGDDAGLLTGDLKRAEQEESKKKRVILGTYQICGTGFDLPKLNTLVLATPRGNVVQMVGRILRKDHEIAPRIYDIWDDFSLYKYMGAKRKKYYENTPKMDVEFIDPPEELNT